MKIWPRIKALPLEELMDLARKMMAAKSSRERVKLTGRFVEGLCGKSLPQLLCETPPPWLVAEDDLRRHMGLAIGACEKGRTVFFYHRSHDSPMKLMSLVPEDSLQRATGMAQVSFALGRYRRVSLDKLSAAPPPMRPSDLTEFDRLVASEGCGLDSSLFKLPLHDQLPPATTGGEILSALESDYAKPRGAAPRKKLRKKITMTRELADFAEAELARNASKKRRNPVGK